MVSECARTTGTGPWRERARGARAGGGGARRRTREHHESRAQGSSWLPSRAPSAPVKSGTGTGLPDVGSWSCGGGSCGGSCDGSCGKRGWKWPLCSGWSAEEKRFVFAAWPFRALFSSLSSRCHRLRMAWSVRPGNDWEIWLHLCPCACGVAPRLRSELAAAPREERGKRFEDSPTKKRRPLFGVAQTLLLRTPPRFPGSSRLSNPSANWSEKVGLPGPSF